MEMPNRPKKRRGDYYYFDERAFAQIVEAALDRAPGLRGSSHEARALNTNRQLARQAAAYVCRMVERQKAEDEKRARRAAEQAARGSVYARMLATMRPGFAYARRDLIDAGFGSGTVHGALDIAEKRGHVARLANPDHDPTKLNGNNPRFLFEITAKGQAFVAAGLAPRPGGKKRIGAAENEKGASPLADRNALSGH